MAEVLAILPMRGGSQSIPYKSIVPVLGRPLCHYTIVEAKKSELINRFIVYTGDSKIVEVAQRYGLEVPVVELEEKQNDLLLFQDCLHGLEAKEGYRPDIVVHLRATLPLRKAEDIDKAIKMLLDDSSADCVRGFCEPDLTPFKMYVINEDGSADYFLKDKFPEIFSRFPEPSAVARQNFPPVWRHSGQIDVTRWSTIMLKNSMAGKRILPIFTDKTLEVDIDHYSDLPFLEFMIKKLGRDRDR